MLILQDKLISDFHASLDGSTVAGVSELDLEDLSSSRLHLSGEEGDQDDRHYGEPFELEDADPIVEPQQIPRDDSSPAASNGDQRRGRLADIARGEQRRQAADSPSSERIPASRASPADEEGADMSFEGGDDSSLAFYVSPSASPGSNRRASGGTRLTPQSAGARTPAASATPVNDLATLAKLVESGSIQSIE